MKTKFVREWVGVIGELISGEGVIVYLENGGRGTRFRLCDLGFDEKTLRLCRGKKITLIQSGEIHLGEEVKQ